MFFVAPCGAAFGSSLTQTALLPPPPMLVRTGVPATCSPCRLTSTQAEVFESPLPPLPMRTDTATTCSLCRPTALLAFAYAICLSMYMNVHVLIISIYKYILMRRPPTRFLPLSRSSFFTIFGAAAVPQCRQMVEQLPQLLIRALPSVSTDPSVHSSPPAVYTSALPVLPSTACHAVPSLVPQIACLHLLCTHIQTRALPVTRCDLGRADTCHCHSCRGCSRQAAARCLVLDLPHVMRLALRAMPY
jgi:hypothetical protein